MTAGNSFGDNPGLENGFGVPAAGASQQPTAITLEYNGFFEPHLEYRMIPIGYVAEDAGPKSEVLWLPSH